MPQFIVNFGRWLLSNDTLRAYLLGDVRALVMWGGGYAVGRGWISADMLNQIAVLAMTAVPFYLGHVDVKGVAENTVPVSAVAKALAAQRTVDQATADRIANAIAGAARTAPKTRDALLAELAKGEPA